MHVHSSSDKLKDVTVTSPREAISEWKMSLIIASLQEYNRGVTQRLLKLCTRKLCYKFLTIDLSSVRKIVSIRTKHSKLNNSIKNHIDLQQCEYLLSNFMIKLILELTNLSK